MLYFKLLFTSQTTRVEYSLIFELIQLIIVGKKTGLLIYYTYVWYTFGSDILIYVKPDFDFYS